MLKQVCIPFLVFLFISSGTKAHSNNTMPEKGTITSFNLLYGYKALKWGFYDQMNRQQKFSFSRPPQFIGFGISGHFIASRSDDFDGHFEYRHMLPASIRFNDTIRFKTTGFCFSYGYGKDLLASVDPIDLVVYVGFNTGRMRIYDYKEIRQKNPFFSPKFGADLKFAFARIAIAFRFEYDWDISKPNWRRTLISDQSEFNINPLKQSGWTALVQIGYTPWY